MDAPPHHWVLTVSAVLLLAAVWAAAANVHDGDVYCGKVMFGVEEALAPHAVRPCETKLDERNTLANLLLLAGVASAAVGVLMGLRDRRRKRRIAVWVERGRQARDEAP